MSFPPPQWWRDRGRSWIIIYGHLQEAVDSCSERVVELIAVERPHDGRVEPTQQVRRQVVEASAFRREAATAACQRQSLVPQATDPVLRLPHAAPLDRDPRADGAVRRPAPQAGRALTP